MSLQGEGVAYRGRILVELSTKLDQKTDKAVDTIHSDDILVVQVSGWFLPGNFPDKTRWLFCLTSSGFANGIWRNAPQCKPLTVSQSRDFY